MWLCTTEMVRRGYVGFLDARSALITALQQGVEVLHEDRDDPEKNQLKRGTVTVANVVAMAKASQGPNYRCSPHHDGSGRIVHELKNIRWQGSEWYLKWFFDDSDLWFISVHQSTSAPTPTTTGGSR